MRAMRVPMLLLLALVAAVSAALPPEIQTQGRLPAWVRPEHYALQVQPHLAEGNFTFDGTVRISLTALAPTSVVYLHSLQQRILSVTMTPGVAVASTRLIPEHQLLEVSLDKKLTSGNNYTLTISYTGNLKNNGDVGFYLTKIDGARKSKYGASATLEPMYARIAFPCFDEPALKAQFAISIIRDEGLVSLSNMPLKKSTPLGVSLVKDEFETSPPMSTYLVAMVVGEYVNVKQGQYGVWGPPAKANALKHALDILPVILDKFGKLFQSQFPLPKMDLVGVDPFMAGALENWGLVVFDERSLFYEPSITSSYVLDNINKIVAHELAHQWFGDLVTLDWWDQLYLNEGFASFFEIIGKLFIDNSVEPDWGIVMGTQKYLLGAEKSKPTTVVTPIKTSKEAMANFGAAAYKKASCLIRMLLYHVGVEDFVQGLRSYIKTNQYGNANSKQLYSNFKSGNRTGDIGAMMKTWLTQPGFPHITVTRDYKKRTATISQSSTANVLFHVPITYTDQKKQDFNAVTKLLLTTKEVVVRDMPAEDEWVLFNIHQAGYYTVEYDQRNLQLLNQQIKTNPKILPALNLATLQDSLQAGGMSDAEQVQSYLETTASLTEDPTAPRWQAFLTTASHMDDHLGNHSDVKTSWQNYLKELITPHYQSIKNSSLQLEGDKVSTADVAEDIVTLACHLELDDCPDLAQTYYQTFQRTGSLSEIPESFQFSAICNGVSQGGKKDRILASKTPVGRRALKKCGKTMKRKSFVGEVNQNLSPISTSNLLSSKNYFDSRNKVGDSEPLVVPKPDWNDQVIASGVAAFLKDRRSPVQQFLSSAPKSSRETRKDQTLMKELLKYAV